MDLEIVEIFHKRFYLINILYVDIVRHLLYNYDINFIDRANNYIF